MRTRLVYVLSFWLLSTAAASVLAMGALTAWNLREGFGAYLQARDLERLDAFVELAAKRIERNGAQGGPTLERADMRALLRELALQDGTTPPDDARPDARPPDAKEMDRAPGKLRDGPPPRRDGGFGSRVAIVKPDGTPWVGPRVPADAPGLVERPIRVAGKVVAIARLRPVQRASEASETRFLRTQYTGIAAVATALLLLSLAAAVWLARQWVRPLAAVKSATTRIARGELGVRVAVERNDEVGDVMRNVNMMAESLQRIEGVRRQWLANLSHELRTPLARLRGEVEALVDGIRPRSAEAMISLREEVLRLGLLVDDLHLLAVADLNGLPCYFAEADAAEVMQTAITRHVHAASEAGLTLRWAETATATAPIPVQWDTTRIEQLLSNVLQNSIRYTDAPGVIELAWQVGRDRVHVSIDDSAPGVAEADQQRIFEPLYRADPLRSRAKGGSGLGLAICNAIVEAHGGTISASASALGGLRVYIELPCDSGERRS